MLSIIFFCQKKETWDENKSNEKFLKDHFFLKQMSKGTQKQSEAQYQISAKLGMF